MRLGCEWGVFRPSTYTGFHQLVQAEDAQGIWSFAAQMVSLFFSLNLLLGAFNLIPLPPLDGSSLPFLFLDEGGAQKYRAALHHPSFMWLGLFVAWKVFDFIYPPIFQGALKLLYLMLLGR